MPALKTVYRYGGIISLLAELFKVKSSAKKSPNVCYAFWMFSCPTELIEKDFTSPKQVH